MEDNIAQETQEKTIYLILIILVVVIVLLMWAQPKILEWFKQLPGYQGENDRQIIPDADTIKAAGGCVPGESLPATSKAEGMPAQYWIYLENPEIKTKLFYDNKNDYIYISIHDNKIAQAWEGLLTGVGIGRQPVGAIDPKTGVIRIYDYSFQHREYGAENLKALGLLQNAVLTNNNFICRVQVAFTCGLKDPNAKITDNSRIKYNENKISFERYSEEFPSPFDKNSFKSLLAAFAEKENWKFDDNGIKSLSDELKNAINNNNDNPKYMICNKYTPVSGEKIMCIASVYNQNEDYVANGIGKAYAKDIISLYKNWQSYFCQEESGQSILPGIFSIAYPLKNNVDFLNSCFSYRGDVGGTICHPGVDLKAKVGDSVYAVADGRVIEVNSDTNNVNSYVLIDHKNGLYTGYLHIQPTVTKGTEVLRGAVIGKVKDYPSGAHLHFEVRERNPKNFLQILQSLFPNQKVSSINNIYICDSKKLEKENTKAIFVIDSRSTWLYLNPLCYFNQNIKDTLSSNYQKNPGCSENLGGIFKGCSVYGSDKPLS